MPKPPKVYKPFRFPISFSELLRFLMPQKRPEDRMRFFRAFVVANLSSKRTVEYVDGKPVDVFVKPTDQDLSDALTEWKSKTWDERHAEHFGSSFFVPWFFRHTKKLREARAKTAA